jgi:hypothetical protein
MSPTKTTCFPGLTIGAGCSLAQVKDILAKSISELPEEKTQTYQALLKHLRSLAGQQIRNMAVSSLLQSQGTWHLGLNIPEISNKSTGRIL